MSFAIDGIVPVIPTPFSAAEEIAWEEFDRLIDFAVSAGACAVCLPAYASEFYKLSEQERFDLIRRAVSNGRIPVIAQVNSPSLKLAIEGVRRAADLGASAISTAVPRLFALPERDILSYFEALLGTVDLPFAIQDFNPSGATLGAGAIAQIRCARPNLRYVKLEDALLASRVQAIRDAGVDVLTGWGGTYMLDLIDAGIAGVMPGLGLTDLLGDVWRLARSGDRVAASRKFEVLLPQIVYSLQNLELFHHVEKRLLRARGVLGSVVVRRPSMTLTAHEERRIDELNEGIVGRVANPPAD